jgi:GMP reductase
MRIINDTKLDFSDVLILPKRSTLTSREEVSLEREFAFRNSPHFWSGVPIMAANMDGVGTFEMAEKLATYKMFTCLRKNYSTEDLILWIGRTGFNIQDYWAYGLGIKEEEYDKFNFVVSKLPPNNIKFVCIDVANGYTERFVEFVKRFRAENPTLVIIAGNVVTGEMCEELLLAGADIIKVGIGPGSVCTTRLKTGVGYPQLSAIIECADAAHGLGGHIISDGGCTCPGDVSKAFGAGADFVMLGGMLAGHDQGGGDIVSQTTRSNEVWIQDDGTPDDIFTTKQFVKFYGMSSKSANEKHSGGLKSYRAAEGKEVAVPYCGDVSETVQDILGGVRSTLTYVGAKRLKELSKRTTFVRVNNQVNNIFSNNS